MLRAPFAPIIPTHEEIAGALHEWYSASSLVKASPKAELYTCAVTLVRELLEHHTTCVELVTAFYSPDTLLMQVVLELGRGGEIRLQPRLIMGAACAARLRHLVAAVAA